MINVFLSYAHNEEDREYLNTLIKHLAPWWQGDSAIIKPWEDSTISPGKEWDDEIRKNLYQSQIVLLLVSADFNASDYIYRVEMQDALNRHREGTCRVIPILIRDTPFKRMPYADLEMLPKTQTDQKLLAVDRWENRDQALRTVAEQIGKVAEELHRNPLPQPAAAPVAQQTFEDPWHRFFDQAKLKKEYLGLLETVNCNRTLHYRMGLRKHFKDNYKIKKNLASRHTGRVVFTMP